MSGSALNFTLNVNAALPSCDCGVLSNDAESVVAPVSSSAPGPGMVAAAGTAVSTVLSLVQIPPDPHGAPATSENVASALPSGASQKIQAFSSPSSVCACTLAMVAPVTATDGVSVPMFVTASLNATISCGRSPAPVCARDANRLAGKLAERIAASLFRMVPVARARDTWNWEPAPGLESLSVNVSPLSSWASSFTGTVTVCEVGPPGSNVSVPLVAVESLPALAVRSAVA